MPRILQNAAYVRTILVEPQRLQKVWGRYQRACDSGQVSMCYQASRGDVKLG